MKATDKDSGRFGEVRYSITSVTNNGRNRFTIDATSGEIRTAGAMNAGASYVVVVEACDRAPESSRR